MTKINFIFFLFFFFFLSLDMISCFLFVSSPAAFAAAPPQEGKTRRQVEESKVSVGCVGFRSSLILLSRVNIFYCVSDPGDKLCVDSSKICTLYKTGHSPQSLRTVAVLVELSLML